MGTEVPQSSPATDAAGVNRHCRSYAHNHQLAADGVGETIAQDRHYTPAELSKMWHLSPNTIRRLFSEEAGVLKITAGPPSPRKARKRRLVQLRIPVRVAMRVHAHLTNS
jgi:hypothetical protein